MKRKLKQIPKAFILCLIVFFAGCDKDDFYDVDKSSTSKPTARYVLFNEFKKHTKAFQEFKEIESKHALAETSRLIYLSLYDFYIDTDKILLIQNGDYLSYTFQIYKDIEMEKVENLVIVEKDSSIEAYITKYTLNDEERLKILSKEVVDLTGKYEIENLNRVSDCWHVIGFGTREDEHGNVYAQVVYKFNSCTGEYKQEILYVKDESYNDSNDTSSGGEDSTPGWFGPTLGPIFGGNLGPTNGTPGNYSGSGTIDPLWGGNTVATFPLVETEFTRAQLRELASITNNSNKPYKAKVSILQQSLNLTTEVGFEFRTDPNSSNGALLPAISVPTENNVTKFGIPAFNTIVRMHSHHNGLDPIFSEKDVIGMSEFYSVKYDLGANDAANVTSLMISRSGAFALKVEDEGKLFEFNDDLKHGQTEYNGKVVSLMEAVKLSYKDEVVLATIKQCNNSCTDAEYINFLMQNFIMWLESWDTGLNYYQGTLNPDGTYTWTKKNN
jgi:hypothetical protein